MQEIVPRPRRNGLHKSRLQPKIASKVVPFLGPDVYTNLSHGPKSGTTRWSLFWVRRHAGISQESKHGSHLRLQTLTGPSHEYILVQQLLTAMYTPCDNSPSITPPFAPLPLSFFVGGNCGTAAVQTPPRAPHLSTHRCYTHRHNIVSYTCDA